MIIHSTPRRDFLFQSLFGIADESVEILQAIEAGVNTSEINFWVILYEHSAGCPFFSDVAVLVDRLLENGSKDVIPGVEERFCDNLTTPLDSPLQL